ncbi:hypothetical protein F9L33_09620 [Amylibacter sp. SFDW26]|uniref:PEP/pyruvate-binding domain-containing protein n=1 Tax=Amylibacter sp. SFDW26 TaxID=2652722 RepID=UPI0012621E43|nr:PEP/pyruvate-binding domain-containing protein [Amylibacter sp. SFDW26]KAB7613627.1 hypothetical protein F9L33_09620 [Amylibacter sp. SFDW26]
MIKKTSCSQPQNRHSPSLPQVDVNSTPASAKEPLSTRMARFDVFAPQLATLEIDPKDGTANIIDDAAFEVLSHRDDVPGALGVREVKFLVTGADTRSPKVYFLNTKNQKYHFYFARNVLNVPLDNGAFNAVTYFTASRRFLAGTLIAHDNFNSLEGTKGLYALEFWPTDNVTVNFVQIAFDLISAAMPFAVGKLAYHPSGAVQEDLYEAEQVKFEAGKIRVVSTEEIFKNVDYSPLNLGVGFGRLRVIDGSNPQPPSIRDVVIFKTLPNDLSHVAGVLSEEPQTPLSHINLRAKQNDTPNAYLRNGSESSRLKPHIGDIIRYEVKPDEIDVRNATAEELEEHLEQQRPKEPQYPPADLTKTEIVNLDDARHADIARIGAKAANVAELRKVLRTTYVPAGFAVPFHFYDEFMKANGFYDYFRHMIMREEFQNDDAARGKYLKQFRRKIKKAEMPNILRDKLGIMFELFPTGTSLRCRSSTNNEDLMGFNGAGLYDSFTHRKDEGHIEKSIKQVWSSLWNFRAFEEREFYRIDHFTTAMGVLVHPNFDEEQVNGVALTKNIYFPEFGGYYINAQIGEALVTNPEPKAVSEELLVMEDANPTGGEKYELIRIRRSNLVKLGESVMSDEQLGDLIEQMEIIQTHFKMLYNSENDDSFAMDIEFKITVGGTLAIKQARPWVD